MDAAEFTLADKAVRLAIAHVIERGSDDVFRPPLFSSSIEHDVIVKHRATFEADAYSETIKFIKQADLSRVGVGPVFNTLIAKDERSFRQVSWMDPFDAVKYLTVGCLLFPTIEQARIPPKQNIVHSHRMALDGAHIFDAAYGYDSFRLCSGALSRDWKGKWKVITDVSNFFDRIGNHSLESHLLDIGCKNSLVTLLREMLFFWTEGRRSHGIPVGSDASRIVSEAVLIDIDRTLQKEGVTFVRYVDDFRIFADTRAQAYSCVRLLTSLLADEGLALNSKKTEIHRILDEDDPNLDTNRFGRAEHEVLDLEEKQVVHRAVRVSGRTQISRHYKEPGKEALRNIKKIDKADMLSDFESTSGDSVEDKIKLLVKFFVYVDQDVNIIEAVIRRRVTSIFYVCDALIKECAKFDDARRLEIISSLMQTDDWLIGPYPYQIPLLRLMASAAFSDENLAHSLIDTHRISDNHVFLRELVSISYPVLDRQRVRKLALDTYSAVPDFLRRAILRAVARHPKLSPDEKRPLIKNMKQATQDWFVHRIDSEG